MERPPARRDLIRERLRRTKDSHIRRHDRHVRATYADLDVPSLLHRQDSSPTVPQLSPITPSTAAVVVSTSSSSSSGDVSRRESTITSAGNSTVPLAGLILSAALLKSSADAATATPTSIQSSTSPVDTSASSSSASPSTATSSNPTDTGSRTASASTSAPVSSSSLTVPDTARVSAMAIPQTSSNGTVGASSSSVSATVTSAANSTSSSSQASTLPLTTSTLTSDGFILVAAFDAQTTYLSTIGQLATDSSTLATTTPSSTGARATLDTTAAATQGPSGTQAAANNVYNSAGASTPTSVPGMTQAETSQSSVPTPTVVGSVIGGVAGLSLVLIVLLFLFRRIKRKRSYSSASRALPGDDANTHRFISPPSSPPPPFAGVAAAAGGMAHRLSRTSRRSIGDSVTPEMSEQRSFERVSGRKLASQFSPAAQGPPGSQIYPPGSSLYPSDSPNFGFAMTATSSATHEDPFADSPFADPPASPPASPPRGIGFVSAVPAQRSLGDFHPIRPGQEVYQPGPQTTPMIHQVPTQPASSSSRLAAPTASPTLRSATPDSRSSRFHEDFV